MKRPALIPIHNLQERGKHTFEVHHVIQDQHDFPVSKAHRDDNYLLIFQLAGVSTLMVDFKETAIKGNAIFCVLPGQVHYGIASQGVDAWVIAVNTDWVQNMFRPVLMEAADRHRPVSIDLMQSKLFEESLGLLEKLDVFPAGGIPEQILRAMLDVCLGLFVSVYQKDLQIQPESSFRPAFITRQFRYLLLASFRTMKSPVDYAKFLNISSPYLNEVVKATTGYPVSHWIHQEIILEAKRMLFYTNNNVKEIAVNLGYTDVPYFIRLFGKVTGLSPLQFRNKYRK